MWIPGNIIGRKPNDFSILKKKKKKKKSTRIAY